MGPTCPRHTLPMFVVWTRLLTPQLHSGACTRSTGAAWSAAVRRALGTHSSLRCRAPCASTSRMASPWKTALKSWKSWKSSLTGLAFGCFTNCCFYNVALSYFDAPVKARGLLSPGRALRYVLISGLFRETWNWFSASGWTRNVET